MLNAFSESVPVPRLRLCFSHPDEAVCVAEQNRDADFSSSGLSKVKLKTKNHPASESDDVA
jgi:hypothetical protein